MITMMNLTIIAMVLVSLLLVQAPVGEMSMDMALDHCGQVCAEEGELAETCQTSTCRSELFTKTMRKRCKRQCLRDADRCWRFCRRRFPRVIQRCSEECDDNPEYNDCRGGCFYIQMVTLKERRFGSQTVPTPPQTE